MKKKKPKRENAQDSGLPPEKLYKRCAGLAEAARQLQKEEQALQLLLKFESKITH